MVVGRRIGAAMVLAFAAVGAPFPGLAADAMSKSALQGLAPGLARDFGPRGITVNAIQPGPTDTDMNPADGPLAGQMHSVMAIEGHGTAEDVASLALYLADASARGITGAMHTIDGGFGAGSRRRSS